MVASRIQLSRLRSYISSYLPVGTLSGVGRVRNRFATARRPLRLAFAEIATLSRCRQWRSRCRHKRVPNLADEAASINCDLACSHRNGSFERLMERLADRPIRWLSERSTDPSGDLSGKTSVQLADPSGNVIELQYYDDAADHMGSSSSAQASTSGPAP